MKKTKFKNIFQLSLVFIPLVLSFQNCAPTGQFSVDPLAAPSSSPDNLSNSEDPKNPPTPSPTPNPTPSPNPGPQPNPLPNPQPQPNPMPAPMPMPPPAPQPQPPQGASHLYLSPSGSDTNPGTQAAPLRTIPRAASLAKPGTVIHVAPGTYTGSFITNVSGTAEAPIVFVSDVKHKAKLIPASSTSDSAAWRVAGNYVVVDGFEVDGQSSLGWRRGLIATGNYITFKNNLVHHIAERSACDSSGGAGITADGYYGAHHHTVINNITHHIGNGTCGKYHGIYVASFDYKAQNNLLYEISGPALFGNHDSGRGVITNNTVFRSGKGILVSGADFIKISAAGPFIIENNIVYDNNPNGSKSGNIAGIGIYGKQVSGSRIANNYVFNNRDVELYMVSGAGTISNNITSGSPGFIDYQIDGSGNYRLSPSSPLLNRGALENAPRFDLEDTPRPQGTGIDLGAYETKAP